jgi:hypothetical protein
VAAISAAVQQPVVKVVLFSGAAFLGLTFAFSVYKVYLRFNSSRSKRRRTVNKNVVVVEALAEYLPAKRAALTPGVLRSLARRTGFTEDQLFRKQLRYLLNERAFDDALVADVLALRSAAGLSDAQLAAIFAEASARTFKKTGVLMRRPRGMTAEGLARKAQGRALFSKLLFLIENEALIGDEAARDAAKAALLAAFGATTEDADALRIPSLLDADALERLWATPAVAGGAGGGGRAEGDAAPAETFSDEDDDK